MSQSYVIRVSASVQEKVQARDKRSKRIVLTEIVPAAEQREILADRLRAKGWVDREGSEGQVLTRTRGKVVETIDLDALTLEAEVQLERTLERSRTVTVRGDRDLESEEARRDKEHAALQRSIAITDEERQDVETAMQRDIASELEATDAERDKELNEVVREVYAESLKRRAKSLGTVTSVQESQSGQDYELVIKITE